MSLGIQSLDDTALAFLGRRHSARDALKALEIAATYFPRFSFDLIYARPQQTRKSWKSELLSALAYAKGIFPSTNSLSNLRQPLQLVWHVEKK